jgi:[ribosomal protein S5]-alanine N-acetyltransferase
MLTEPLESERLIIRTARVEESPLVAGYYRDNREHLEEWEPKRTEEFFTDAFWSTLLAKDGAEARAGRQLRLFFFDRADPDRVIGTANFSHIVRGVLHGCVLGYSVGARDAGRGFMREGLTSAIGYMFQNRGLHRIEANYMPHNVRSGRLLRTLGFTVEGYARDYLLIAGRWEDHVLTSLTNQHWVPTRSLSQ